MSANDVAVSNARTRRLLIVLMGASWGFACMVWCCASTPFLLWLPSKVLKV